MGDARLRKLARDFHALPTPERELDWLTERTRAGEALSPSEYLRLSTLSLDRAVAYLTRQRASGSLNERRLAIARLCADPAATRVLLATTAPSPRSALPNFATLRALGEEAEVDVPQALQLGILDLIHSTTARRASKSINAEPQRPLRLRREVELLIGGVG